MNENGWVTLTKNSEKARGRMMTRHITRY